MNKEDLKSKISKASYIVTQEHGTEAPFSGELLDTKEEGIFTCVCCCLLYTSPSPRDVHLSRMPSSA